MKKVLVLLIISSMGLMMITGCSSKEKTNTTQGDTQVKNEESSPKKNITVRLAWLGEGDNKEKLDKCIELYTEKTGVKIETVFIPGTWAEYLTKIKTMIAGGEKIDAAMVAIEGFRMMADMGIAKSVSPYFEGKPEVKEQLFGDIADELVASFSIDGEAYAVPTEWNNVVVHMNKKLFEEAGVPIPEKGWGKEELLDICSRLTKEVDGVKQYALEIPNYYFAAEAWVKNNGGAFMTPDFSRSLINEPESVEMFQLWQDLIHKYGYAPIPEPNVDGIQTLVDGKIAMGSWGRWPTANYVLNEFDSVAIQYIPEFKTNNTQFGVGGITIMTDENYEAACDLAVWMGSPEFGSKFFSAGSIPASRSLANDLIPKLGMPENHEIYYESVKGATPVSAPIQYAQCETIFNEAMSAILLEEADVQVTLDKAADRMNKALNK